MKGLRASLIIITVVFLLLFLSLVIINEIRYHFVQNFTDQGMPFVLLCIVSIILLALFSSNCLLSKRDLINQNKDLLNLRKKIACITENNETIIMEYDVKEQKFILWNEDTGKEASHFLLNDYWKRVHPEDLLIAQELVEHMNSCQTNTFVCEFRYLFQRATGYSWQSNEIFPFETDKEGKPVTYIGVCRKNNDWHEMLDELKNYKSKVSFITSISGIIFADFSTKTNILYCLCDRENFKGYNMNLDEYLDFLYPEDRAKGEQVVKMMKEHKLEHFHTEYRFMYPWEKEYVWYSIDIAATAYDASRQITGYTWLNRNNNAWHKAMDEMLELQGKAKLAMMQTSFLSNINHEIRTPLNAIVGFSNIMCDEESYEERLKFKNIIDKNNQKLLRIVDDALLLSKIESDDIRFKLTEVNVTDFFKKLTDEIRSTIGPCVQLICKNDKPLISTVDITYLKNITLALLSNAIKFTHEGTITLDCSSKNNGLYVSVSDTGIGIAKEEQERIFGRFEKIDSFKEGTGIGLPICKAIITKINGKIGVESELGKGSTFWYWVPRRIAEN